jgi:ABC-2 type transport system permease protein
VIDPMLGIFLRKELRDIRATPRVWPGYFLLPLFGVLFPVIMLLLIPSDPSAIVDEDTAAMLRFAGRDPALAQFPERERLARLAVRDVGLVFLLMPMILSATSAALAIAGEKQQRTLEPILATPISDRALLLAKLLASLGPSMITTWVAAIVGVAANAIVTSIRFDAVFWPGWPFAISVVFLSPLCGAAAALMGMRASIRSSDVDSAIQTAGIWVVPVGLVLAGGVGRLALRSTLAALIGIGVTALIGWWFFQGNVRRFQREEILTRWN